MVFPGAVLAVHQLRYLLAYGSHAGTELTAHGDRYVGTASVIAGTLVGIALAVAALRLAASSRGRVDLEIVRLPPWLLWLGLMLLLLAGFCALELLEIAFEPHRTVGVVSIVAGGGWWALPAAAFVAAVMALLVYGGRALLLIAARGRAIRRAGDSRRRRRAVARPARLRRPMASGAAGRAPPLTTPV